MDDCWHTGLPCLLSYGLAPPRKALCERRSSTWKKDKEIALAGLFHPLRRAPDATKSAASYFPQGTCPAVSLNSRCPLAVLSSSLVPSVAGALTTLPPMGIAPAALQAGLGSRWMTRRGGGAIEAGAATILRADDRPWPQGVNPWSHPCNRRRLLCWLSAPTPRRWCRQRPCPSPSESQPSSDRGEQDARLHQTLPAALGSRRHSRLLHGFNHRGSLTWS